MRRRGIWPSRVFHATGEADAAVATFPFADFSEPVFSAQLIEPRHKLGRRHSCSARAATPRSVIRIESPFGKRLGVRRGLDTLGEVIDNEASYLSSPLNRSLCWRLIATYRRFGVACEDGRAKRRDELNSDGQQKGEWPTDVAC